MKLFRQYTSGPARGPCRRTDRFHITVRHELHAVVERSVPRRNTERDPGSFRAPAHYSNSTLRRHTEVPAGRYTEADSDSNSTKKSVASRGT